MALHIDLPIYKLAYDLLDLATDLTRERLKGPLAARPVPQNHKGS